MTALFINQSRKYQTADLFLINVTLASVEIADGIGYRTALAETGQGGQTDCLNEGPSASREGPDMNVQAVLLYDGLCVLCSAAVRYTLHYERTPIIRFVAIQSSAGHALAQAHRIDAVNPDSFLFIENGHAFSKADGVMALARHLDGPLRLMLLGRFVPRPIRNWVYDRIARNRYRIFGKRSTCWIPDPSTRHRFTLP